MVIILVDSKLLSIPLHLHFGDVVLSAKISQNLHPAKITCYTVVNQVINLNYNQLFTNVFHLSIKANSYKTTQQEQKNTQIGTRYRLTLSCPASRVVLTMDTESTIECLLMCTYDKQCKRAMYKSDTSSNCELMTGEPVRDGTRPNYIQIN